jgi:hypothetical protein
MAGHLLDRGLHRGLYRALRLNRLLWALCCLLPLLIPSRLAAETFKLYLKAGDYHMVREYQVIEDRVRYYSTERGEWEEIPKELVDLDKTETERKKVRELVEKDERLQQAENKYERAEHREVASIPAEPGAYFVEAGKVRTIAPADWKVETSNKRHVLQVITPVPIVAGKATVTVKGEHSNFVVHEAEPEFYVRLDQLESFGIMRLTPKKDKDQRIVENVSIVPVTKQNIEDLKEVETYQREMTPGLYKIWPAKALVPGEYALVEYTQEEYSTGELHLQIWDFSISSEAAPPAAPKNP